MESLLRLDVKTNEQYSDSFVALQISNVFKLWSLSGFLNVTKHINENLTFQHYKIKPLFSFTFTKQIIFTFPTTFHFKITIRCTSRKRETVKKISSVGRIHRLWSHIRRQPASLDFRKNTKSLIRGTRQRKLQYIWVFGKN